MILVIAVLIALAAAAIAGTIGNAFSDGYRRQPRRS